MEFNCEQNDSTVYVSIAGALDPEHVEELNDKLHALLYCNLENIILNLSQVRFLSGSAVSKILMFYMDVIAFYMDVIAAGKKIHIQGTSDYLYDTFQSIKLNKHLQV